MKRIFFSVLALLAMAGSAAAQPCDSLWTRSYGEPYDAEFDCILPASDGGYYVGGYDRLFEGSFGFLWLVRLNAEGDTIWTRTYGPSSFGMVDAMAYTPDGGLILAGYTSNVSVENDVWIMKMNSVGDSAWSRTYPNDELQALRSVKALEDGYVFVGYENHGDSTGSNVWLMKLGLEGDSLWNRRIGGIAYEAANDIIPLPDGGFAVAACKSSDLYRDDYWLVRTNANGDTLWTRTYNCDGKDVPQRIIQTANGDFLLAGYTDSYGTSGDIWLLRTNIMGDSLWSGVYGGLLNEYCIAVFEQDDGDFVVAGSARDASGMPRAIDIFRTHVDGTITWQRTFSTTRYCYFEAHDMVQTDPCGFTIAGGEDFWNHTQAILIRMYTPEDDVSGSAALPEKFSVRVFPNPFNASTNIVFTLPQSARVNLAIYDITGREVETRSEWFKSGENRIRFDVSALPTGIYFANVNAGEHSAVQKLMLLK